MKGRARWIPGAAGLLLVLLSAPTAGAQEAAALFCPTGGAELATVEAPADPLPDLAPEGAAVDTTYQIAVAQRRWSEREVNASVAAGAGGTHNARWRACAGAWVEMRRVEMLIEEAHGTVRIRASLEPLLRRLRARDPQPEATPNREGS